MARPHLGRAGAGALLVVACLLVVQAINSGAEPAAGVRSGRLSSKAEAATFPMPSRRPKSVASLLVQPPAPQPVIPLGRPALRLPILMYHYIRVNPVPGDQLGFNLSVTPADFRAQLDWLAASGYHPVDFDDLRAYYAGRRPLPAKPVILTFDDGYREMYTAAFPALKAHHFKAVSYVVTGFVGGPNYMTWDMVRELDANGVEIGAHTFSHIDLTTAPAAELRRQLVDPETTFQALLGHPVVDFCYPSGRYNATVVAAVQAAGYQTATTTRPGLIHSAGDRFTWTRVRVSGGEGLDRFAADLAPVEPAVAPAPPFAYVRIPTLPRLPLAYSRERPAPRLRSAGALHPLP